jgi:hypothetical protein
VWRKDAKNWSIESPKRHSPNVLSCELVSGEKRTTIIVVYLPPNDLDDLPYLDEALQRFPDITPIVLGDLNVDLDRGISRATKINACWDLEFPVLGDSNMSPQSSVTKIVSFSFEGLGPPIISKPSVSEA